MNYSLRKRNGAGNGTRTRDINLGKVALYQLSYSRSFRRKKYYAIKEAFRSREADRLSVIGYR